MIINDIEDDVEARHWNECMQIAHYDDELSRVKSKINSLKEQVKSAKLSMKSENSDFLTGYITALSAVEGMIDEF